MQKILRKRWSGVIEPRFFTLGHDIVKAQKPTVKLILVFFSFTWGAGAEGPSEEGQGREGTAKC